VLEGLGAGGPQEALLSSDAGARPGANDRPHLGTQAAAAWLWLPICGAALGDRSLGLPWLRLGDIALALFMLATLPRLIAAGRPTWPAHTRALVLLLLAAAFSGLPAWLAPGSGFVPIEFAKSLLKLIFYACGSLCLSLWLQRTGARAALHVTAYAFALAALIGIGIYGLTRAGVALPTELVCGSNRQTCSALYYERRWFGDNSPASLQQDVFLRAQGLASEPTRFGYLQAMALGLLLLYRPLALTQAWPQALIALSALLSFALAPYALLLVLVVLLGVRLWRGALPALRRRVVVGGALLVLLCVLPPLGPALERIVLERVVRMATGQSDASAFLRVAGSWVMAQALIDQRPLTGAGLGHFDLGVAALRAHLPHSALLQGSVQGWNVLAHVLGTLGLVGLLAFLHLCRRALAHQPALAVLFMASLFADGTFLGAALWVFLALFAHVDGDRAGDAGTSEHAPRTQPAGDPR
jgi:hypothetical protein